MIAQVDMVRGAIREEVGIIVDKIWTKPLDL